MFRYLFNYFLVVVYWLVLVYSNLYSNSTGWWVNGVSANHQVREVPAD